MTGTPRRQRAAMLGTMLFVATAAAQTTACTSASSSIVAPSSGKCDGQVAATASSTAFGAEGGAGTLQVTAARECAWSARSEAPWITLPGTTHGQGEAALAYHVAANVSPTPRRGLVGLSAARIEITQQAAPCRYTVYRGDLDVPAAGGALAVYVAAMPGCPWTVRSAAPWVTISHGATGNGPGEVGLSVLPNTGLARTAIVTVEDQLLTVSQAGR